MTAQTPSPGHGTDGQENWRGVATEDADELSDRRRHLPARPLAPAARRAAARRTSRALWGLLVTITVQNLAWLAGPFLIGVGIDVAVPALIDGERVAAGLDHRRDARRRGRWTPCCGTSSSPGPAGSGRRCCSTLRRRVFTHVQRLPLAFHERYTSGKTISRLTSDVEALAELLDEGLDNLVTALFSVLTIGVVLVVLDPPLGLVALLGFPPLFLVARWFQRNSTTAYRRTRETIAALIVQFTETFGGIRAVQAFRREPRNDELHAGLNEDNRQAHDRAFWLIAVFVPAVTLIGNLVTVAVLGYGALRVHRRRPRRRHPGVVPAVPAPVLRPAAGRRDVLQLLPVGVGGAGEAVRGARGASRPSREPARPGPAAAAPPASSCSTASGSATPTAPCCPQLDLRIPAGQTVALVGATGAGKSTLARLAARFYDPVGGAGPAGRRPAGPAGRRRPAPRRGDGDPGELPVLRDRSPTTSPSAGRTPRRTEIEAAARAIGAHEFIAALPAGLRHRRRTGGAAGSRPGSGSWSASPAPSWPTRRC